MTVTYSESTYGTLGSLSEWSDFLSLDWLDTIDMMTFLILAKLFPYALTQLIFSLALFVHWLKTLLLMCVS
ncbi:hypothetical protein T07_15223 [Trichinella nelsoni]|uniref:Uncharacterized protein n=1 Tax=Trichinella nelsoni TaxID=6336 RepID=A0A0V0SGV3_9BILA|nr:hypothetical protein T07_15223 [Trichinella nelsoni]